MAFRTTIRIQPTTDETAETSTGLLRGLFDSRNADAWREFEQRYAPIIRAVARRCGLCEADVDDVAQEALLRFLSDYQAGKYCRERGRLRAWLIGIVRHRVLRLRRWRAGRRELCDDSAAAMIPFPDDPDQLDEMWEQERRRRMLHRALHELRECSRFSAISLTAFERVVFLGQPVAQVADDLGITVGDVYTARLRITQRLRGIVERLEHERADVTE